MKWLWLAALFPLLLGCESAEAREARSVLEAIGRFRTADNTTIPSAVDTLKATPCSATEVCEAKDACVAAGEQTARALRLKHEVEQKLSLLEKGQLTKESAEAQELPKKLDDAEALLKKGHDGLPSCDERVQGLKRKHHI